MTVKKLIDILQDLDNDIDVFVGEDFNGVSDELAIVQVKNCFNASDSVMQGVYILTDN